MTYNNWELFQYILTWIPAFAFPTSHLLQIYKMISSGQVKDVSAKTFYGYFIGNMGAYLFTEKYTDPRTILAYLLTSFLEIVIVTLTETGTQFQNIKKELKDETKRYKLYAIILSAIMIAILVLYIINYQQKYLKKIASYAGFLPALLFPSATIFQIWKIVNTGKLLGVSCKAWILQILANIGAYFLTSKLMNLKSIMAFLLTASLDLVIVLLYFYYGGNPWDCIIT